MENPLFLWQFSLAMFVYQRVLSDFNSKIHPRQADDGRGVVRFVIHEGGTLANDAKMLKICEDQYTLLAYISIYISICTHRMCFYIYMQ